MLIPVNNLVFDKIILGKDKKEYWLLKFTDFSTKNDFDNRFIVQMVINPEKYFTYIHPDFLLDIKLKIEKYINNIKLLNNENKRLTEYITIK